MRLTAHDRAMLATIWSFGLITRAQVQRFLRNDGKGELPPGQVSYVRQRLRLFFDHWLVERFHIPVTPGAWAYLPIYRLAKRGAEQIAATKGLPVEALPYWGDGRDRRHRRSQVNALFIRHALVINDVRIAVTAAAARHGLTVGRWLSDWELRREATGDDGPGYVVPDGYLMLVGSGERRHFFLEVDKATMTIGRWREKVEAYGSWLENWSFGDFGASPLRILTVTTTRGRLAHLKRATETLDAWGLWWFSTLEEVSSADPLADRIWSLTGQDHRVALLDASGFTERQPAGGSI